MKRIIIFIIPLLIVLLSSCTTDIKQETISNLSGSANVSEGIYAIGTLASIDSIEWVAARAWTKLTSYRLRAANLLKSNRITAEQAIVALNYSDQLRQSLDEAIIKKDKLAIVGIAQLADSAMNLFKKAPK